MTSCPDCAFAEATWWARAGIIAGRMWQERNRSPLAGMAGMMNAALGRREPTWYEKHRQAFEETGDAGELARMLRHVA